MFTFIKAHSRQYVTSTLARTRITGHLKKIQLPRRYSRVWALLWSRWWNRCKLSLDTLPKSFVIIYLGMFIRAWEHDINGRIFVSLTEDDLKDLFPVLGERLSIATVLRQLKKKQESTQNSSKPQVLNVYMYMYKEWWLARPHGYLTLLRSHLVWK